MQLGLHPRIVSSSLNAFGSSALRGSAYVKAPGSVLPSSWLLPLLTCIGVRAETPNLWSSCMLLLLVCAGVAVAGEPAGGAGLQGQVRPRRVQVGD
jgi:hypothetical protein